MSAPFEYSEALVADQLGLPRDAAKELREKNLRRGTHWKKNNGDILLTETAVERIASLCLTKMPDLERCKPAARQEDGNGAHPLRKKLRVVPPMPINPRLVYGQDDDGERHVVDVGRNGTFVYDDEIEVEPHPEQQGIFICVSPTPRDRRRPWRR
jgi:hypothetical protein